MTILMLWFMRSMYPSSRLNAVVGVGAALVFIARFAAMRTQAAIGNAEFLRSMIPHNSCNLDVRASLHHRSRNRYIVPRDR